MLLVVLSEKYGKGQTKDRISTPTCAMIAIHLFHSNLYTKPEMKQNEQEAT